jgi:hypothetical protein
VNKDATGGSHYGLGTSGATTSRLGLRGTEDLGGGLKAGFWLEGEIFGDDGNASGFNFKRRSTVSLSGNFGEVRLGRDLTEPSKADLLRPVRRHRYRPVHGLPVTGLLAKAPTTTASAPTT